jgi:hypothetical protein
VSAEVNVVLAYRLWPRSILNPPFTEADRVSMSLQATGARRRQEETIDVNWVGDAPAAREEAATR